MIKNFRDVVNNIETFCTNHNQIHDFDWGRLSEITTKDHDFTMLFLQPTGSVIDGHEVSFTFDVYIFDLMKVKLFV